MINEENMNDQVLTARVNILYLIHYKSHDNLKRKKFISIVIQMVYRSNLLTLLIPDDTVEYQHRHYLVVDLKFYSFFSIIENSSNEILPQAIRHCVAKICPLILGLAGGSGRSGKVL